MLRKLIAFWGVAFQTLQKNPGHTFLSTLGIVIGVAALVAILALGDGMESYGRDQLLNTTDLQEVRILSRSYDVVDGMRVARDSVVGLEPKQMDDLYDFVSDQAAMRQFLNQQLRISLVGDTLTSAAQVTGLAYRGFGAIEQIELLAGDMFGELDSVPTVIVGSNLTDKWKQISPAAFLQKSLIIKGDTFKVSGVMKQPKVDRASRVIVPLTHFEAMTSNTQKRNLTIVGNKIEMVADLKDTITHWLNQNTPGGANDFTILTNEFRLEQISEGMTIFKLIMGLITGLSVLVGGIGVMNVLLMSITERTKEIGIRKAIGATRLDISLQFLLESLSLSLVGSISGFLLGLAMIFGITPIIRSMTEIPFHAALTMNTIWIVLLIAIFIGVLFGTYPAWKASRMTPVDAIRHE